MNVLWTGLGTIAAVAAGAERIARLVAPRRKPGEAGRWYWGSWSLESRPASAGDGR